MKKAITLSVFLSVFFSSFSQIIFNISDVPVAGTTQRIAQDTFPLPSINFGNKGANQVYDFSNLTLFKYDTVEFRTPTSGQLTTCPNADVALTPDGTNFLLTNTDNANNKLTLEGFEGQICPGQTISAAYSTKPDLFRFPTTYQSNFSGTGYLQKTVSAAQVCQSFPVTQVRLTTNVTYTDTIDGWGKVITPVGAYKCLRKQRKETTTTQIEANILGSWTTVSGPSTATTIRYTYITKEAKGSVINFNYDTANVLQSVNWAMVLPTAPVADFSWNNVSGGLVNFTDLSDNYPTSWSWDFGDGSPLSTTQNPNHTYTANGNYSVCLTATNAGGSHTVCKTVNVTLVSAANSAPVAVTDTLSLLQATTITIFHVASNDIDPDGNNVCMTAVWGSPYVAEVIGGSCDMVSITPDSTFVGTDTAYYSICDNGTPSLCDTGMIIFTVVADPNLLPVANYTTANSSIFNCTLPSISADSTFTLTNTSANYDTVYWNIKAAGGACNDSVVEFWTNTVNITPAQFATQWNCSAYDTLEVCMFVSNQFGWDAKCDIICNISWLTTGIKEVSVSNVFIYPNPATNMLTIDMGNDVYSAIEIYNAIGEKVKFVGDNTNKSNKVINVSVSELSNGVYIVTTVDSKGTRKTVGRFTKE